MLLDFEVPEWLDKINDKINHPDFNATMHNPWFLVISAAVILFGVLRGKKALLILYVGAIIVWGIVDKTVLHDKTAAAQSTSGVVVFAGLVIVVAGIAIYFLLIKD